VWRRCCAEAAAEAPMVSLKRFLNASEQEVALAKVVSLLLEKIGTAAAEADHGGYEGFRAEMEQIRLRATHDATAESLFITAGSAVQAMETYNRRISTFVRKQGEELQCIVSMLFETVIKLGGEQMRSVQRLQEIGDKLERAAALEDIQNLKSSLGECLHDFRAEAESQKAEVNETIQTLQQEIDRHERSGSAGFEDLDPVTRLPRQASGIQAMQEAIQSGKRRYAVVMVANRMQSINARFGFHVGDRILRAFKENVEKQLLHPDQLFRWEGPAIVALLDRKEPIEQVRAQIRHILDGRLEETFNVEGRSVMIPVSAAWSAFALMPPLANAARQIQAFISSQGSRDYV
jgi:GGDEF domain-containing protein